MKKIIVGLILIGFCMGVNASEITEDYFDIATNYCIDGDYYQALTYLDKILAIEPDNTNIKDLRNGLNSIMHGKNTSYVSSVPVKNSINAKKIGDVTSELSALEAGNDYWSYYFLGELYKQNKDYKKAISSYIKSINTYL